MFAHKTAGQIWLKSGAAGAAVSILLIVLFDRYGSLERFSLYLVYIQLMRLLLVMPLTEWKISRNFKLDPYERMAFHRILSCTGSDAGRDILIREIYRQKMPFVWKK